jgi:g-D-glutamyl-meso-diaminopimelate peptidase
MITMIYTHDNLKVTLRSLAGRYPAAALDIESIGKSVMGRDLYCLRLGHGRRKLLCVGVHHALEWLTGLMLVCFADSCLAEYSECRAQSAECIGEKAPLHSVAEVFERCSIYIVPMLNPDGVEFAAGRIGKEHPKYAALARMCPPADAASLWQANINGVDLNHNYDALWSQGFAASGSEPRPPGPTRYAGAFPESEPESRALAAFTRKIVPDMVIAYHSQGREIYYDFNGKMPGNTALIAENMAKISGYKLCKPEGFAGFGGFKDWFIEELGRPGFTIEIGKGKNPIGIDQLTTVLAENVPLILYAATECKGRG